MIVVYLNCNAPPDGCHQMPLRGFEQMRLKCVHFEE